MNCLTDAFSEVDVAYRFKKFGLFLNSVLDSLGRQVTHTPYLNGTVSSETGYENVRVEYEVTQGGTDSGVVNVDP